MLLSEVITSECFGSSKRVTTEKCSSGTFHIFKSGVRWKLIYSVTSVGFKRLYNYTPRAKKSITWYNSQTPRSGVPLLNGKPIAVWCLRCLSGFRVDGWVRIPDSVTVFFRKLWFMSAALSFRLLYCHQVLKQLVTLFFDFNVPSTAWDHTKTNYSLLSHFQKSSTSGWKPRVIVKGNPQLTITCHM